MQIYENTCLIELHVNDSRHQVAVRPADLLLEVLRGQLGLSGARPGCLNGDCGACTVLLDGQPVKSCLVLAVEAEGRHILTVEGLGGMSAAQRAFVEKGAFQCGYCTSGFLLVCHALAQQQPQADEYELESWLESNLCRCTSYEEIRSAARSLLRGEE